MLSTVRKMELVLTLDTQTGFVKIETHTDFPIDTLTADEANKCPVLDVGYEMLTTGLLYEMTRRQSVYVPNTDEGYDIAANTNDVYEQQIHDSTETGQGETA